MRPENRRVHAQLLENARGAAIEAEVVRSVHADSHEFTMYGWGHACSRKDRFSIYIYISVMSTMIQHLFARPF